MVGLDNDLENQVMVILKTTTVPIDIDRICAALGTYSESRQAVRDFLKKWDKFLTKEETSDGKAGFRWK